MLDKSSMTHPLSPSQVITIFHEKYICNDINAKISFSSLPNEMKQRGMTLGQKIKSMLFQEDLMGISIHKTELANCGSSTQL